MTYVTGNAPANGTELTVKIRYKSPQIPATFYPTGNQARVLFHEPQRAVTPGQAIVLYQGEQVLGGGFISRSKRSRPLPQKSTTKQEIISVR